MSTVPQSGLCVVCGQPFGSPAHPHEYMGNAEDHAAHILQTKHREAQFARSGLNPATPLYILQEDRLRVQLYNSLAGIEVDVALRLQLVSGHVVPIREAMLPTAARAAFTLERDLTEGFLLDLAVSTPTAGVRVGHCFVVAQIIRQAGANALPSRTLLSNYVNSGNSIGWPEGPNQQSIQGAGVLRAVNVANPGAGADWSVAVPAGARWQLQSFQAQLACSAAVFNRVPHLVITDGAGHNLFNVGASGNQIASQTMQWSGCGGIVPAINDSAALLVVPDVAAYLQGWTIGTVTTNLQAGDQWSNIWLNVIEWNEQ